MQQHLRRRAALVGGVLAQHLDAHLGPGVGDVVVVLGVAPDVADTAMTAAATKTQAQIVRQGWAAAAPPSR